MYVRVLFVYGGNDESATVPNTTMGVRDLPLGVGGRVNNHLLDKWVEILQAQGDYPNLKILSWSPYELVEIQVNEK